MAERAEKMISDKASPIMTKAITAVIIESLFFAVITLPLQAPCKLSSARTHSTMHPLLRTTFTFCLNKSLCYLINIDSYTASDSIKNKKTRTIHLEDS
jgi:hypothetical protein